MKRKGKAKAASGTVETFGGAYHRLESEFRLPEKYQQRSKNAAEESSDKPKRPRT